MNKSTIFGEKVNYIHNKTRRHFFENVLLPSIKFFTGDLYNDEDLWTTLREDPNLKNPRLPRSNYFVLKLPRLDKFKLTADIYLNVQNQNIHIKELPYTLSPEPLNVTFTGTRFISSRLADINAVVGPRELYYQYANDEGLFKQYLNVPEKEDLTSIPKYICVLFVEENNVYYSDRNFNSSMIKNANFHIKWNFVFPIDKSLKNTNSVFEGTCNYLMTYEDVLI